MLVTRCGHCKSLKPAWIEAASELNGRVKVGAVDCTAHQATCSQFGVQGACAGVLQGATVAGKDVRQCCGRSRQVRLVRLWAEASRMLLPSGYL